MNYDYKKYAFRKFVHMTPVIGDGKCFFELKHFYFPKDWLQTNRVVCLDPCGATAGYVESIFPKSNLCSIQSQNF